MKFIKLLLIMSTIIVFTILPVSLVNAADSPDLHELNCGQIVLTDYPNHL